MPKISAKTLAKHRENQVFDIMLAARSIIEKKGLDALNFGSISDRTGLARPSLYEYFKSKSDLLWALAEQDFAMWTAMVVEAMTRARTPTKKVEAFFSSQLNLIKVGRHSLGFIVIRDLDETAQAKLHAERMKLFELLSAPLKELGVKLTDEKKELVGGVLHSSIQMLRQHYGDPQKLGKLAAGFCLGGLREISEGK